SADEYVDDRALGLRDLLVPVGELAEHPGGQDLLERAVDDRGHEPRIELGPELALRLAAPDDPLDHAEDLPHVPDPVLDLADARGVEPLAGEDPDRRVQDLPAAFD